MKDQNILEDQLTKLKEISNIKIDPSFITGYFAFAIPLPFAQEIKPLSLHLVNMAEEGLISQHNIFQIMAVLKINVIGRNPKNLMKEIQSSIQTYINELALDNFYLRNRYFRKEPEEQAIISESLGIECPVCSVDIQTIQLCYLSCGHMYHIGCLNAHCNEKISNKIIPIPCPYQNCKSQLLQQQITQFLQPKLRDKYDEFAFQNYVENHMDDTSWCPTPGCSAVFAFDQALTNYKCPACKKHYCLTCKCEFHNGFSCEQYKRYANLSQDDKQFMFLVKGAKYKQCPNCKFWVEKNEGCDHMTCRCKYQFCYVCGGKYNRCKCKGFVNEAQQPKLLDLLPADNPNVSLPPVPPVLPVPPVPPVPSFISGRKMQRFFSRSQIGQRGQRSYQPYRFQPRKIRNISPARVSPPRHEVEQQWEDIEKVRLMQQRQQEQLIRMQEEQMQRAIKLSEEQSIQNINILHFEQEKPKLNFRMEEQISVHNEPHSLESIKNMQNLQGWKVQPREKQPYTFNKSWRPYYKQGKEQLEDKNHMEFKEFPHQKDLSQKFKPSFFTAASQKFKEIKFKFLNKNKKEENEIKPNFELKELPLQFKYPPPSENLIMQQEPKQERAEQKQ